MKNILLKVLCLLTTFLLFSCEKELQKFEEKAIIYFNETVRLPNYVDEVLRDSTVVSFSLAKGQDSVVKMVVKAIGVPQDFDRPYKLSVNPVSDAVSGQHYEILNADFVIRRNEITDTVAIKLYRLPVMQEKTFLLSFDLQDNEHFATSMKDKVLNSITEKKISYVNYRWYMNDIIKRPVRWYDGALGIFSRKKLFLMVDILGVDPAYLDTAASIAEAVAYGKFMQRYLNEQKIAGNTIYEEDGTTVMTMGPTIQ